jgi:phosphoribosylaminoimidazolecarboxamide formyltransferase/IMP cyclohydrolase
MNELELKYGLNPVNKPSRVYMADGGDLPITILNGKPGYINLLDALNAWQLVKELAAATGKVAAASFKHVSPAGSAIAEEISVAYKKARSSDPDASYGDFIALSCECDVATAEYVKTLVSDGIIAPSYNPQALEILKSKKKGNYPVIQIDTEYEPKDLEVQTLYGITFEQFRDKTVISTALFDNIVTENKEIPEANKLDLLVATITAKWTQSNTVVYAVDGQAVGIGAGQQSRIACTKLAGDKTDRFLTENKAVNSLSVSSDAFFPFADNVERAYQSGVKYIAQPGGSIRDDEVIAACNKYGIVMCFTGLRLFKH